MSDQEPGQTPKKQNAGDQLKFEKVQDNDVDNDQDLQSLPPVTATHTTVPSHVTIPPETLAAQSYIFSHRVQILGRTCIMSIVIAALIFGRSSVPDEEGFCQIKDYVQDKLANILGPSVDNRSLSKNFQALSSIAADLTFLFTFTYWILYGKNSRFPVALTLFYAVRSIFLMLWFTPTPEGFFWDQQGIPSLLIYYEKDSGFYFSKYIGFITICTKEWGKIGKQGIRKATLLLNAFLIMVSLIFRVHYIIDIFTAVFFADWCFDRVDWFKDSIDNIWISLMSKARNPFIKKKQPDEIQIINI